MKPRTFATALLFALLPVQVRVVNAQSGAGASSPPGAKQPPAMPRTTLPGPATLQNKRNDSLITPTGVCRIWSTPSGSPKFPADASYNTCALDRRAKLISGFAMPSNTFDGRYYRAPYMVVVNADGTVNRELTDNSSSSGNDGTFPSALSDSMSRWRFQPAMRNGKPVRSALPISIETSGPTYDTLPATIEWQYHATADYNIIEGKWRAGAAPPALSAERLDSLYMTYLHRLVAMKVVVSRYYDRHCLVMYNGDSVAHKRLQERARYLSLDGRAFDFGIDNQPPFRFAPYGCERTPDPMRIILPRITRLENNKVKFESGGDFLPNYPDAANGRSWRSWKTNCQGTVPDQGDIALVCSVSVGAPFSEYADWYEKDRLARARLAKRGRPGGDSVFITAVVTTQGAAQKDTIRSAIASLPRIMDHALSAGTAPCGASVAFTQQNDSAEIFVIHGNPYPYASPMQISRVKRAPVDSLRRGDECSPQTEQLAKFVAFVAGGMSGNATAPITMMFSNETKSFVIDPAKHFLPQHLSFRISDLRAATCAGKGLRLAIYAEAGEPLIPIVVVPTTDDRRYVVVSGRQLSGTISELVAPADVPPDGRVFVYLIRLP